MYAVIETGGKQYRVQQGDVISVEKLKASAGEKVTFEKVLVVNDGTTVQVGTPVVADAAVYGTVVENGKGPKVIIYKYKSKKDYRKKQGHRQPYSMIQIEDVMLAGTALKSDKPTEAAPVKKAAKKPAAKKIENEETTEKKSVAKKTAEKKSAVKKTAAKTEKKPSANKATKPEEK